MSVTIAPLFADDTERKSIGWEGATVLLTAIATVGGIAMHIIREHYKAKNNEDNFIPTTDIDKVRDIEYKLELMSNEIENLKEKVKDIKKMNDENKAFLEKTVEAVNNSIGEVRKVLYDYLMRK